MHIAVTMTLVFVVILGLMIAWSRHLVYKNLNAAPKTFTELTNAMLPSRANAAKREFEIFALKYTVFWIAVFAVVIIGQLYENFDENSYMILCVTLAAPLLLQPFIYPMPAECSLYFWDRYSFKANLWIAIFSFIGNYWYTHYFYSVLQARYTFPAHRLNDVPIALYFATHFYFITYHTFANLLLRRIEAVYEKTFSRRMYFWLTIFVFSYFTAFMETLTISSFPYYTFADRDMVYKLGSAFYGIYFLVSFPVFYRLDEHVGRVAESRESHTEQGHDNKNDTNNSSNSNNSSSGSSSDGKTGDGKRECAGMKVKNEAQQQQELPQYTVFQTVMEAMGSSMIVLLLLDFCRLGSGMGFHIEAGTAYYLFKP